MEFPHAEGLRSAVEIRGFNARTHIAKVLPGVRDRQVT